MLAVSLDGWQLVIVVLAVLLVVGFIVVFLAMREGRSRKVRVGVFVEREYLPEEEYVPPSEWPTNH